MNKGWRMVDLLIAISETIGRLTIGLVFLYVSAVTIISEAKRLGNEIGGLEWIGLIIVFWALNPIIKEVYKKKDEEAEKDD